MLFNKIAKFFDPKKENKSFQGFRYSCFVSISLTSFTGIVYWCVCVCVPLSLFTLLTTWVLLFFQLLIFHTAHSVLMAFHSCMNTISFIFADFYHINHINCTDHTSMRIICIYRNHCFSVFFGPSGIVSSSFLLPSTRFS